MRRWLDCWRYRCQKPLHGWALTTRAGTNQNAGARGRATTIWAFCRLIFKLGHSTEFAETDRALHDPTQLTVFGNVALHKNCCDLRIEPYGEQYCGQLQRLLTEHTWSVGNGECVQVDDAVKDVVVVLTRDPIAQCTQIIAEMDFASRLDAGKDSGHATTLVQTIMQRPV